MVKNSEKSSFENAVSFIVLKFSLVRAVIGHVIHFAHNLGSNFCEYSMK
jgi:hypothetical protein